MIASSSRYPLYPYNHTFDNPAECTNPWFYVFFLPTRPPSVFILDGPRRYGSDVHWQLELLQSHGWGGPAEATDQLEIGPKLAGQMLETGQQNQQWVVQPIWYLRRPRLVSWLFFLAGSLPFWWSNDHVPLEINFWKGYFGFYCVYIDVSGHRWDFVYTIMFHHSIYYV